MSRPGFRIMAAARGEDLLNAESHHVRRTATALLALALLAAPSLAQRYSPGQEILVHGIVKTPDGAPAPGMRVVLEASRSRFRWRAFGRERSAPIRRSTLSADDGSYELTWAWNRVHDRFDLVVGTPVEGAEGFELKEMERLDLTRRIAESPDVELDVILYDVPVAASIRRFTAEARSADEQRVRGELGPPEKVQKVEYPDRTEVTWWYFERGRAYRFEDGDLVQVIPFDPIEPAGTAAP